MSRDLAPASYADPEGLAEYWRQAGVEADEARVRAEIAVTPRSIRAVVRNPLLALAGAQRVASLPPEARAALRALLLDIRADAQVRAAECWRKHKAPMACYWKAVAVYAGHAARITRDVPSGEHQQGDKP